MKWLGVSLLPSPTPEACLQSNSPVFHHDSDTDLYSLVERGIVIVKRFAQQHNNLTRPGNHFSKVSVT